jgi:glycosyltransferase involved in cell wall biosynthesis
MPEPADAFFHLDYPTPEASLETGPLTLRGWLLGRNDRYFVDLRAVCGNRYYPGTLGFLRPDLAEHFQTREKFLPAGFELPVLLAPGENLVVLEACDISGQWLAVAELKLTAAGPARPPQSVSIPLPTAEFGRALRLVLSRPSDQSETEAVKGMAEALPHPQVLRYAPAPFHGHLHHPGLITRAGFGRVLVEGWLFHETLPLKAVAATVDLHVWQPLHFGGKFDDVPRLYPQFPHARGCRVNGAVDVPSQLPRPVTLRLYAQLPDDSWHLCHVQRLHTFDGEDEKRPFASQTFLSSWRAARALRGAVARRGFHPPKGRPLFRELRAIWADYRRHKAHHRARPPAPTVLPPASSHPRHIWLVTHNLNLEGAPLFLLELARQLRTSGSLVSVLSGSDGPLRGEFSSLGAVIQILDLEALRTAESAVILRRRILALGGTIDLPPADLIIANTLACYWGVHLARQLRRPSLFYIHESTTPESFFLGQMQPETLPVVEESFHRASHVSFLTAATRRYYDGLLAHAGYSLNPGWIDVGRIDRFRATHRRSDLRTALGLRDDQWLVANIGTVCDRKGQQTFARAVDLLWRAHPDLAARCVFLMVGGRETLFDRWLADTLQFLRRDNLRVLPETSEPYRIFGAADFFVCSSHEESFPRVVLEAMAFQLPIVSSGVHGVPEMTRHESEALLVPPGDSSALAGTLTKLLGDPTLAGQLAQRARARVAAEYDSAQLLPRHAALAAAVAAQALRS